MFDFNDNCLDSDSNKEYTPTKNKCRFKINKENKEIKRGDGCKRYKTCIENLRHKYEKVFSYGGDITYCRLERCRIITEPGKKMIKGGQIMPRALVKKTVNYLEDLEKRKMIKKSTSEWRNLIRAIEEFNGDIILVNNSIALNSILEKDEYRPLNVREIIRATQGAGVMAVFDLKERFYYVEIAGDDTFKMAFESNGRLYEWNSKVMGFKNFPRILQRIMDRTFLDLKGRGVDRHIHG